MEQIQTNKKENINNIDLYTHAAWGLSYSAFWELLDFSISEVETARQFINAFISNGNDPYANYLEYCQRVLMAYNYIKSVDGRYIPLPSAWFDKTNEKGFIGTIKWMHSLICKRRSVPLYRIELKAMAEAVLEMTEDSSVANFRYWKNYLLERNQEWLYSLLISVVMHGILGNKRSIQNN